MLTIRLSRIGKKNKPLYRLIISEKSRDPWGKSLEILGSYNPYSKELQTKSDRISYWIGKGAEMSPTVNNLLIDKGVIKGDKTVASKRGKVAVKAEIEAKNAARLAAAKPAEVEEVKEEAPAAEEAKTEEGATAA